MAFQSIDDYFIGNQVVGIQNVDTRAIVRHVRDKGAMNAIISSEITDIQQLQAMLDSVPDMEGLELSSKVSTPQFYTIGSDLAAHKVAVLDFGIKQNILRCLNERDAFCGVFNAYASAQDIHQAASKFASLLKQSLGDRVLGPETPHVSKLRNLYLRHILVKYDSNPQSKGIKPFILQSFDYLVKQSQIKGLHLQIDVDC